MVKILMNVVVFTKLLGSMWDQKEQEDFIGLTDENRNTRVHNCGIILWNYTHLVLSIQTKMNLNLVFNSYFFVLLPLTVFYVVQLIFLYLAVSNTSLCRFHCSKIESQNQFRAKLFKVFVFLAKSN